MKKSYFIILAIASLVGTSCLKLMKTEPFDTTGNWYSKFSLPEFLVGDDNDQFKVFAEAASHSGLLQELKDNTGYTLFVPSDEAFSSFLTDYGIEDVKDIPANVLLDFLRKMVVGMEIYSTSFRNGDVNAYVTLGRTPIYVNCTASGTNPYRLLVNKVFPQGVKPLGGPSAEVVTQDMAFKDHIVQVVDAVPFYAPAVDGPETFTGKIQTDDYAKVPVHIDTYIYQHAGFEQPQVDKSICANSERFPVIWYEDPDINFEIAVAKVYFFRSKSSSEGIINSDFSLHDISSQIWALTEQGTNENALKNAVVSTYVPTQGVSNYITTFTPASTSNTWFSVDITRFIKAHYASSSRIPIGFSMQPITPFKTSVGLLPLGYKIESTGSTVNNPSYMEIFGPVPSKTELVNNKTLECPVSGSAALTINHLKRQAAADAGSLNLISRNIIYSLLTLPKNGCLTINGIPLSVGYEFNQSQIEAGVIRYYHTGDSTEDSFMIKCSDYTGSVMGTGLEFKVAIL